MAAFIDTVDKYSGFTVRQSEPFNGGPDPITLRRSYLTPNNAFYARNHSPIPHIDPLSFRLKVDGYVVNALSFSLDDLKHRFFKETIIVTLQCAGNRRNEMAKVAPMPGEAVLWETDAISTAEWSGVRLIDILNHAMPTARAMHVEFVSLDRCEKNGEVFSYGGSIPFDDPAILQTILAYEMNGEPLPVAHGYPLRAIVPGYIAARSVKWLGQINLSFYPSDNFYQQRDYKLFPPDITAETADWSRGKMLTKLPTDSVICVPQNGATIKAGMTRIEGYAIASVEKPDNLITCVELSSDGGTTWMQARLLGEHKPFAWRFWEADMLLAPGEHELIVRAHDSIGSIQPQTAAEIWNFKGYMNNSLHRVKVLSIEGFQQSPTSWK